MAIWQFSVEFIPRKNLIERFGKIPETIDEEILCKENLEEGVELPPDYESFLSTLGEKEHLHWVDNLNWGNYDHGTHITIDHREENKVTVFARFDVGNLNELFIKTVLEFAEMCDCVLLTKNENIIEPVLDLFIEELKNSNSYRFCKDPAGYL